jgi:hypothetical protein
VSSSSFPEQRLDAEDVGGISNVIGLSVNSVEESFNVTDIYKMKSEYKEFPVLTHSEKSSVPYTPLYESTAAQIEEIYELAPLSECH